MIWNFLFNLLLSDLSHKIKQDIVYLLRPQYIVLQSFPAIEDRKVSAPKLKNKNTNASLRIIPKISAKSALVVDVESGKVLFEKNGRYKGPIASITKLMTAIVFLENKPNWEKVITMKKIFERNGAWPKIYRGEQVKVRDLFYTSLVSSDNNSTVALVKSSGIPEKDFVKKMNEKAKQIGMVNTFFVEPTGLSEKNVSNVYDLAKLIFYALKKEKIADATTRTFYSFIIQNTGKKRIVHNTDKLLDSEMNRIFKIKGGKTGFTFEAGSCLGVLVEDKQGKKIIVIVLGSKDNNARFQEVKALTKWTFENYIW